MKYSRSIALMLSLVALAVIKIKVVNGKDARPGAYPYQAQLLANGHHNCGGSLIHPCYVLTTKRCVNRHPKNRMKVRLGGNKRLDPYMTEHSVVHIIKHPHIDVALVHITPSANLVNLRIETIALATAVRAWIMRYIPSSNPPANSDCNCIHPARKPDGTVVPASFDGANCYLGRARSGCGNGEAKSFIWANKYYITSSKATSCPMGSFDSCNCYVMRKPNGGFIYHNKFYQKVPPGGCPSGTSFDGANCFIKAAPWATTAFEFNGAFYTTARKQCAEPKHFGFDGANCYFRSVPAPNPFIFKNAYYTDRSGGRCPSGSGWDGAHCYYRRAPWATIAFVYNNAFYSTTRKQCYQGHFDGANCVVMTPPLGATAVLHNGNYYYRW